MKKKFSLYWLCQIGGWGAYAAIYSFFYFTLRTKSNPTFFYELLADVVIGIIVTHIMRFVIHKTNLLRIDINRQIIYLLIITASFAFLYGLTIVSITNYFNWGNEQFRQLGFWNRVFRAAFFGYSFILLIWNLIYFTYHYVVKSRTDQLDKVRLENLVKELELKTIKSHINPHFIFNALNSIRALVDENPPRARTAITELSNLLRSSMHAEKLETTSLEKELDIVKDYLALEHIRFEDRLQVEYEIDEDTLDQPVPPMMLQTLVENAIKHGVSRQVDGGLIKIISQFKDTHHELIVCNSGKLNGIENKDGFGLASTQNRLQLMFGEKAHFEIKNIGENMVQAKVIMPAYLVHT